MGFMDLKNISWQKSSKNWLDRIFTFHLRAGTWTISNKGYGFCKGWINFQIKDKVQITVRVEVRV